jgi:hypothetical protein
VIKYYIKAELGAEDKACEIITSAIENALQTAENDKEQGKKGVNFSTDNVKVA